jgi:hypothetical protein
MKRKQDQEEKKEGFSYQYNKSLGVYVCVYIN